MIKKEATFYKTQLIPIDSEHFSVSKLIENKNHSLIKNIYITASGGPFLNWKKKVKLIQQNYPTLLNIQNGIWGKKNIDRLSNNDE